MANSTEPSSPAPGPAARIRRQRQLVSLPGVGAQGASVADVRPAFDADGCGALVAQSRGIMQCFGPADRDWREQIAAAAEAFAKDVHTVAGTGA